MINFLENVPNINSWREFEIYSLKVSPHPPGTKTLHYHLIYPGEATLWINQLLPFGMNTKSQPCRHDKWYNLLCTIRCHQQVLCLSAGWWAMLPHNSKIHIRINPWGILVNQLINSRQVSHYDFSKGPVFHVIALFDGISPSISISCLLNPHVPYTVEVWE